MRRNIGGLPWGFGEGRMVGMVINPEPSSKVWFMYIKGAFHPIFDVCRHSLESGMPDPVSTIEQSI